MNFKSVEVNCSENTLLNLFKNKKNILDKNQDDTHSKFFSVYRDKPAQWNLKTK